jgi:hypothetical protein
MMFAFVVFNCKNRMRWYTWRFCTGGGSLVDPPGAPPSGDHARGTPLVPYTILNCGYCCMQQLLLLLFYCSVYVIIMFQNV